MEYRSAIVDELGCFVAYCSELDPDEQEHILEEHPEYEVRCIECDSDGYPVSDWGVIICDARGQK